MQELAEVVSFFTKEHVLIYRCSARSIWCMEVGVSGSWARSHRQLMLVAVM